MHLRTFAHRQLFIVRAGRGMALVCTLDTVDAHRGGGGAMTKSNILVGLVDDHAMMRAGLAAYVRSLRGFELVFEASSAEAALYHMRESKVQLLLTDILLPAMSGIDLTRAVRAEFPQTRILMFTGFDTPAAMCAAREAGAHGLISKMSVTKDLSDAITTVGKGGEFWPADPAAPTVDEPRAPGLTPSAMFRPRSAMLSIREKEVFRMIGRGLSSKQIAEALGLSIRTIDVHRANIKRKLGTRTTSEMLKYAVLANDLDPIEIPVIAKAPKSA
jgi:DNA-binding NarL/FixJ family response regulator